MTKNDIIKDMKKILTGGIFVLVLIILAVAVDMFLVKKIQADSIASDVTGWAWSSNIGWISFNSSNCDSDDDGVVDTGSFIGCPEGESIESYGVSMDNSGNFSGQAWSSNIGWISFNESETGAPPSDDPCGSDCIAQAKPSGQIGKSNVFIEGWMRALSACNTIPCSSDGAGLNSGGWDGWIRFDYGKDDEAYIDENYIMHGWAWGDEVVGWVSLNSVEGGGYIDYEVELGDGGSGCVCDEWVEEGCDTNPCSLGQIKRTRSCNLSACGELECLVSSLCMHKECDGDNLCVSVLGEGEDGCNIDNDCKPIIWRWWEVIPR